MKKCRDLSLRTAELQLQKGTTFFAAKSYEQAGTMAQQMNDLPLAAKYYDKAGQLLNDGGQRDSAAILYERYATQFSNFDRKISIDFCIKGARIAEVDDKLHQASELYEKAAMQSIRLVNSTKETPSFLQTSELFEKCAQILAKMERYDRLNRVILYRILLKLFNDDSVAGRIIFDRSCNEYPSFAEWEERDNIQSLLDAFDLEDKDLISQQCQKPFFMAIDPEFVRLLKKWIRPLTATSGGDKITTTTTTTTKPIQLDDGDDLK